MTYGDISAALIQLSQDAIIQSQDMMAQANREVVPHSHQQSTMASRLRDFTRMNPPTFHGSKVDDDPQDFIDEVSKIIFAKGLSTSEKVELDTYPLNDVVQAWFVQ